MGVVPRWDGTEPIPPSRFQFRQFLLEERHHGGFLRPQVFQILRESFFSLLLEPFDHVAVEIRFQHDGMHVTFPANGRRIAEYL